MIYCFGNDNQNQPPTIPEINGPTCGKTGESLTFLFNAVDPDKDDVRFIINWSDTTTDTTDFVSSGTDISVSHIWAMEDTYKITAYAEDSFGNIGSEATFIVVIPRDKALDKPLLLYLQNHQKYMPTTTTIITKIWTFLK